MAKKNLREKDIRHGLESLRRDGFDVDSPSASMVNSLRQRLGVERDVDLAIAHLLGRTPVPEALDALTLLASQTDDKELRKEVRRSLFRLAQKGVTRPKVESEGSSQDKPGFRLLPDIEGYLSQVDPWGNRLVFLLRPQTGGGLFLLQAAVNEREGLKRIVSTTLRRKDLRQMFSDMKTQHELSVFSVPWEYADWVLYQAYEKSKGSAEDEPRDYPTLRGQLTPSKPKQRLHPVYDRLDAERVAREVQPESSHRLVDDPCFTFWRIDEHWLSPYIDQLAQAQGSRIVLNRMQQEERLQSIVREATRAIFLDDAAGPVFQKRFEDAALLFLLAGNEAKAKLSLSVAVALEQKSLGALGIPVLEDLVRRSLALHLARDKAQPEEPSLIVKP